jgi:hypothetical protein
MPAVIFDKGPKQAGTGKIAMTGGMLKGWYFHDMVREQGHVSNSDIIYRRFYLSKKEEEYN